MPKPMGGKRKLLLSDRPKRTGLTGLTKSSLRFLGKGLPLQDAQDEAVCGVAIFVVDIRAYVQPY